MINIIIRTSYRPASFRKLLESIQAQTYKKVNIIIGYDNDKALEYIPSLVTAYKVTADKSLPYFYDTYVNQLLLKVENGWIVIIDDDDTLASPTVLQQLSEHLTGSHEAIICQMLRNGVPKPTDGNIKKRLMIEGKIGLPCLILHSKHKALSRLDGQKAGDYRYIKEVTDQVSTKFIALPLVNAGTRGHGKPESFSDISNISV